MDDPEKYICVLTGFVKATSDGYYVFGTESWGGTKLYLGKQLVIDQPDTDHVDFQAAVVPMKTGFYPIRVEHILKIGQQKMDLMYALPEAIRRDEGPSPIPWQALYAAKE